MNTTTPTSARTTHCWSMAGPRNVSGVGLIEVLVAVAILAFGMLGVAALQATALKSSQSSLERSQAVALTYNMFERMRANRGAASNGAYDIPKTCTPPAPGTQVGNDLNEWIQNLHDSLGDSDTTTCGAIKCVALIRQCKITIWWDDTRGDSKGTDTPPFVTITGL